MLDDFAYERAAGRICEVLESPSAPSSPLFTFRGPSASPALSRRGGGAGGGRRAGEGLEREQRVLQHSRQNPAPHLHPHLHPHPHPHQWLSDVPPGSSGEDQDFDNSSTVRASTAGAVVPPVRLTPWLFSRELSGAAFADATWDDFSRDSSWKGVVSTAPSFPASVPSRLRPRQRQLQYQQLQQQQEQLQQQQPLPPLPRPTPDVVEGSSVTSGPSRPAQHEPPAILTPSDLEKADIAAAPARRIGGLGPGRECRFGKNKKEQEEQQQQQQLKHQQLFRYQRRLRTSGPLLLPRKFGLVPIALATQQHASANSLAPQAAVGVLTPSSKNGGGAGAGMAMTVLATCSDARSVSAAGGAGPRAPTKESEKQLKSQQHLLQQLHQEAVREPSKESTASKVDSRSHGGASAGTRKLRQTISGSNNSSSSNNNNTNNNKNNYNNSASAGAGARSGDDLVAGGVGAIGSGRVAHTTRGGVTLNPMEMLKRKMNSCKKSGTGEALTDSSDESDQSMSQQSLVDSPGEDDDNLDKPRSRGTEGSPKQDSMSPATSWHQRRSKTKQKRTSILSTKLEDPTPALVQPRLLLQVRQEQIENMRCLNQAAEGTNHNAMLRDRLAMNLAHHVIEKARSKSVTPQALERLLRTGTGTGPLVGELDDDNEEEEEEEHEEEKEEGLACEKPEEREKESGNVDGGEGQVKIEEATNSAADGRDMSRKKGNSSLQQQQQQQQQQQHVPHGELMDTSRLSLCQRGDSDSSAQESRATSKDNLSETYSQWAFQASLSIKSKYGETAGTPTNAASSSSSAPAHFDFPEPPEVLRSLKLKSDRSKRMDRIKKLATLKWSSRLKTDFHMKDQQRQRYQEVFTRYDYNHSGGLDLMELTDALADLGLRPTEKSDKMAMRDLVEAAGGEVDFVAFCKVSYNRSVQASAGSRSKLLKLFKRYDEDNSGALSADELLLVFEDLDLSPERDDERMAFLEAVVESDLDGSGEIEWAEFETLVHTVQQKIHQCRREREVRLAEQLRLSPETFLHFRSSLVELHDRFRDRDPFNKGSIKKSEIAELFMELGLGGNDSWISDLLESDEVLVSLLANREGVDFSLLLAVFKRIRELKDGLESKDLKSIFQMYDVDGDGHLTEVEVFKLLQDLGMMEAEERVQASKFIDICDIDGNGTIEEEEFGALFQKIAEMRRRHHWDQDKQLAIQIGFSESQLADLREIFHSLDTEKVGCLTFQDIAPLMKMIGRKQHPKDLLYQYDPERVGRLDFRRFLAFMKEVMPPEDNSEADD